MTTDSKLTLANIFSHSWQLTYGFKWPVWRQFLKVILVAVAVGVWVAILFMIPMAQLTKDIFSLLFIFIIGLIYLRIWTTIMFLAVLRARRANLDLKNIYLIRKSKKHILRPIYLLIITLSLTTYLISLNLLNYPHGFLYSQLMIIPGLLIISPILHFALPLIVDHNENANEALIHGYKIFFRYLHLFIVPYLLLLIIPNWLLQLENFMGSGKLLFFSSVFLVYLSFIWTIPMFLVICGLIYNEDLR